MQGSRKRERRPDWHEFYKNGPPKEIIVIDDDSPPPPKRVENERVNHTTRTVVREPEHATKKRRTGQKAVYEPVQYQQPSYSNPRTTHDEGTGSTTISTDRTTSLQTTAPTSLGSHTSHGSMGAYVDDGVVGQKRKRVTRQQTADEKKRKEIETNGDAYSSYVPPPKPPIKAKDVHVPPVRDVRLRTGMDDIIANVFQTMTGLQKIDDDDGHYIVTPDTDLGDRCKCTSRLLRVSSMIVANFHRSSLQTVRPRHVRKGSRSLRPAHKIEMCHKDYTIGPEISGCLADRITGFIHTVTQ